MLEISGEERVPLCISEFTFIADAACLGPRYVCSVLLYQLRLLPPQRSHFTCQESVSIASICSVLSALSMAPAQKHRS